MPLARRYIVDRMFNVCRIYGTMYTDTMDSICHSIHNKKYFQLFGNKQFFVEAYPIKKKSDCHLGLYKFVKEYGAPDKTTYNGAQEQIIIKTELQRVITLDMPIPRGKYVLTHFFLDANSAGEKTTRGSITGILIFCNRSPIIWHSKRKNGVDTSMFGSEFTAMKNSVDLIAALLYKLRMFGVPIDGSTDILCDNEAVYKNESTPESHLRKKPHSILYHMSREAVASGVCRM